MPAILHGIALLIALNVQSMTSPLAGAWLLFHLAGCLWIYTPPKEKNPVWRACLLWLIALGVSTFIMAPVTNGAATMWVMAAAPILALSMRKEYLQDYITATLVVLVIYAVVLIGEMVFTIGYTNYNVLVVGRNHLASAWPLMDPNNAACVMNTALLPCFYMALRKPKWFWLCAVFCVALYATASRTGAAVAVFFAIILLLERFPKLVREWEAALIGIIIAAGVYHKYIQHDPSLAVRMEIWKASAQLVLLHPDVGVGLGSFSTYYNMVRTEHVTAGYFAHNDLLQIFIEMGVLCAFIFGCLMVVVWDKTTRANIASACVILSVFLHSMMEFQFYLPSVSIIVGLALAHHNLTYQPENKILRR